jgi:hypothetical protein
LRNRDRAFWVLLHRLWPGWRAAWVLVKPATVIRWHRAGFRAFWRWKSRKRSGCPSLNPELRGLIRRMAFVNPRWGAPGIHGELLKLRFQISERTVLRYLPKRPASPGCAQSWRTFLANHWDHLESCPEVSVSPRWSMDRSECRGSAKGGRSPTEAGPLPRLGRALRLCTKFLDLHAFPGKADRILRKK